MMKVCQVTIHVQKMDAALKFYEEVMGLEVMNRGGYPYAVVLKHDGFPIVLHQVENHDEIDYAVENHTVLAFFSEDIGAAYEAFQSKGVEFIHPAPQPFPAGHMAAFRDPSGNILELIQYNF